MPPKHDVNTYMAIRWYANVIENLAISAYAGYPQRSDDIMSFLKGAAVSLELLGQGPPNPAAGGGATRADRAGKTPEREAAATAQASATTQSAGANQVTMKGGIEPDTDCPWQTCSDGSCRPTCRITPL